MSKSETNPNVEFPNLRSRAFSASGFAFSSSDFGIVSNFLPAGRHGDIRYSSFPRPRGFTLAESLLASVVLAMAVLGVSVTVSASRANSAALVSYSQAGAVARQLIEEIVAKPLVASDSTPGWPTDLDRRNYDSVNDYAGYTDQSPIRMLDGTIIDTPLACTRSVTLHQPASLFGTTPAAGDFVIVEVNVGDAAGRGCSLQRLVTRTTLVR